MHNVNAKILVFKTAENLYFLPKLLLKKICFIFFWNDLKVTLLSNTSRKCRKECDEHLFSRAKTLFSDKPRIYHEY